MIIRLRDPKCSNKQSIVIIRRLALKEKIKKKKFFVITIIATANLKMTILIVDTDILTLTG